jgi:threonine aldolase
MAGMGRNFASDNVAPVAPAVLDAIIAANDGAAASYGADELTQRLTSLAREVFETDLVIFPVGTGTAANGLALAALASAGETIFCHETAHILLEECGGPEFYTGGAKLAGLPGANGKLAPAALTEALAHAGSAGAAVSITQATEWGTVYRLDQTTALAEVAHRHDLRLHMDGARVANAIAHLGCSPAAATWRAGVDALSFGATKNGALAAEAVVLFDPALADGFADRRQRAGHLPSKLRFLSAQLVTMLEGGLWLRCAGHANAMAARLAAGLTTVPGLLLVQPVEANELFVAMPEGIIGGLREEGFAFHGWLAPAGIDGPVVRLVTSFATTADDVDDLVRSAGTIAAV